MITDLLLPTPRLDIVDELHLPPSVRQEVFDAALQIALLYAAVGVESEVKGHSLVLGDAPRVLNLGKGRCLNAFRGEHDITILHEDGREVVRRYMNHDGMIVIDGASGRPVMNEFYTNSVSMNVKSGGARTAATLWLAEQAALIVLKISSDTNGEVSLYLGNGDGSVQHSKVGPGRQPFLSSCPHALTSSSQQGFTEIPSLALTCGLKEPLLHRNHDLDCDSEDGEEGGACEHGLFYKGRPVLTDTMSKIHTAVMQSVAEFDGGNAVRTALESNADINAIACYEKWSTGNTGLVKKVSFEAVHLAAGLGSVPILEILVSHCDCDPIAYVNRPTKEFQVCIEDGRDFYCPLHDALFCGQIEAAQFLLKTRADASKPNGNNMTPLHLLAQCGSGWPRQHHLGMIVEELLNSKANLHARIPEHHTVEEEVGCTPMDLALKSSSRFPTRFIYLLAPSYWPSTGDEDCIYEVHLCSMHLPKAAEVLARRINQRASEGFSGVDLQWRIRKQAQKSVEVVMADLFFRAPRAAVDLMDILVVQPIVREPARYPLRSFAAMGALDLPLVGELGRTTLKCAYQPDRVKVQGLWWPEWSKRPHKSEHDRHDRRAAEWHDVFLSVRGSTLYEVEVLALLLPNIVHDDMFKALSVVRMEDADVFASLPVQGLTFYIWRCKARPILGVTSFLLLCQMMLLSLRAEHPALNMACWSMTLAAVVVQSSQLVTGLHLHWTRRAVSPALLELGGRPPKGTIGRQSMFSPWLYLFEFSTSATCLALFLQVIFLSRSLKLGDGEVANWEARLLRMLNLFILLESGRCWEITHTHFGFAVDMLYLVSAKTAMTVVAMLFCATAIVSHEANGNNIAALLWLLSTVISGNDTDAQDFWDVSAQAGSRSSAWVLLFMAIFFHVVVLPAIIASYVFEFQNHAKRRHVLFTRARAAHCGWILMSTARLPANICTIERVKLVLGGGCLMCVLTPMFSKVLSEVLSTDMTLLLAVLAGLMLAAGIILYFGRILRRETGGSGCSDMRFLWMCQRADLDPDLANTRQEDWEETRSTMRQAVEVSALESVG